MIREVNGERTLALERNFLHAAQLEFTHPRTAKQIDVEAPLPVELVDFLTALQSQ